METADFFCSREGTKITSDFRDLFDAHHLQPSSVLRLVYYTDPICSACWAIEPILKKLKWDYRGQLEIEYRMGGLLPNWDGFNDAGNGIQGPRDVAHHWDEIGQKSGMSIDGDIWFEDPLPSSTPPSLAFYAAELQSKKKAAEFLRVLRELLFLEKKNITRECYLVEAASRVGLNVDLFLKGIQGDYPKHQFRAHLEEATKLEIPGFPTFILALKGKGDLIVSGFHSASYYGRIFEEQFGIEKTMLQPLGVLDCFRLYSFLSTREVAALSGLSDLQAEKELSELAAQGQICLEKKKHSKFWRSSLFCVE